MSHTDPTPQEHENVAQKGIKRMDAVVTGVILGGIIASIYGVSRLKEKDSPNLIPETPQRPRVGFWKRLFGKNI